MAKKGKQGKIEGVHVYDPGLLHFIFFVSSALLAILWFAMIGQDYAREWKKWQRDFYAAETEQIDAALDDEWNRIGEDIDTLEEEILDAEDEISVQSEALEELQSERAEVQLAFSTAERNLKFEKARQDERRYHVEAGLMEIAEDDYEQYHAALARGMDRDPTKGDYGESELALLAQVPAWEGFVEGARKIQDHSEKVKALKKQLDAIDQQILAITATKEQKLQERNAKLLGVDRLEDRRKGVDSRISNVFRNLPMLDFMAPQLKIKQTVVEDIHMDVNFMGVDAVDRCQTCHIAIDKPGYEDGDNPLKTHPHLVELFTGGEVQLPDGTTKTYTANHPFEQFGCTVCHVGRGRMTSFTAAAHTPNNPEQEEHWIEEYGWFDDHYWDYPQIQTKYIYSSCFQCHAGEPQVPMSASATPSRALFQQAGCFSCHKVGRGGFENLPKPGPNLAHVASKVTPEWTWKWLEAPRDFRKETLMPHYWGLLNNSKTEEDRKRNEVEIHSIVTYLHETSEPLATPRRNPAGGNAARGERILNVNGCFGCHQVGWDNGVKRWEPRHHGPNLAGVGSKVTEDWLFNWIKNPYWYHPETRMPDLRLSDREVADVVAYLMDLRDTDFESRSIPELDTEVLRQEMLWRYQETMSIAEAEAKVAGMSVQAQQIELATSLIGRYGCFSCHTMNGPPGCGPVDEGGNGRPCFTEYGPIGVELTTEGDKFIEKLDFGHVHIPHTKPDWFYAKLRTPRVWDTGKVVAVKDRLRMPSFGFSEEEADLLVQFILGLKKQVVAESKLADQDPGGPARNRGAQLMATLNCRGCHLYQGGGGAIRPVLQEWYSSKEGMDATTASGYYPPDITGEGAKVQSDWLVSFLQEPVPIRPWIQTVMPSFKLNQEDTNILVEHFNAFSHVSAFEILDCADVSRESIRAGELLASDKYFKCYSCHVQGDKTPGGTPDRWAPDFQKVPERLRHQWIIEWLRDPAALQAGTKMPQFFYDPNFLPKEILGGDMQAQMKAIADYLRCGQRSGGRPIAAFQSSN